MMISLDELTGLLKPIANSSDTLPSEALWIELAPSPEAATKYDKAVNQTEYRTPDGNTIVHVLVDQQGAILGIEIFP